MKRKVLSILLAFVLVLSLLPTTALAKGVAAPVLSFEDVASDAGYYSAVQYAVQNSLMVGMSDKCFAPDVTMTRAMLVTVLYNLNGSKPTDKTIKFTDVDASTWYFDAVEWAAVNGIATDYSRGIFDPDENITYQQLAVMFQNYAKFEGRSTDTAADLSAYSDVSAIANWASGAMNWAVSEGLFTGTEILTLLPEGFVTRAQTATILMRYMNGVALEKRTTDYVSQFVKGDFNDFYEDSSDQLQKSITQDELLNGWNALIQMTGTLGDSLGSVYTKQDGYDIVESSVLGILFNIKVTISYGSDGKPDSMWTSIAPKYPPEPQSTDKWEEVPVTVGQNKLSGMLTLPKGVQKPPVVILVQGSGASDMNEAVGTAPNRPFEDIAHGLAAQGVATLRYNKRTYQYPTNGGVTIQYEVLDDAASAVELLSNDKRVDVNRIYLLGHSLGGMMAPKITADNPQIKGFISMAGSLRPLQDILLDQNKAAIVAETSLTEQQKSDLLAQVEAESDKMKTLDDDGTSAILGLSTNYLKSLNAIDNTAILKTLDVPMLILQGSADFHVYPDKDYKLWQRTLEGRANVTFKLYDGLSHLFMPNQISANGAPDISVYNAPNHIAPQLVTDIATWIKKQ